MKIDLNHLDTPPPARRGKHVLAVLALFLIFTGVMGAFVAVVLIASALAGVSR